MFRLLGNVILKSGADPENFSRGGPTLSKIDSILCITVEVHNIWKIITILSFANSRGGPDPPDPPLDPRMLNDMLQLPSGGLD